jgi:selenocysteine lyase/cysteine desulfurase
MPQPVLDACTQHLELEAVIGGYEASDARMRAIESVYDEAGKLVNAPARNIAIVANATAAFIQAMSAFDFSPGDVIVTTRADYTSYQITYLSLSRRLGVVVKHAEDLPEGGVDPQSVRELASDPKCRLVHVSWIPTHSGLVQDVESIGAICEEMGVPYLIDACQAVGQMPIDVRKLKCDYLSATARKFLRGPRGVGFLYASDRALERGDHPLFVDMRGARWIAPDGYEIASTAQRFEDWEFPYALVLGLGAAARYANKVGATAANQRAFALAARLRDGIRQIDGASVLDRGSVQCAIVTAEFRNRDANEIARELRSKSVNTSVTLKWFGLLDLGERGIETAIRISPHYYNTEEEIDTCLDLLRQLR